MNLRLPRLPWQRRCPRSLSLTPALAAARTLAEAATGILSQVSAWTRGSAYHAYWLDDEGTSLQLLACLTRPAHPRVAPDYSGLVLDAAPLVPLAIPRASAPERPLLRGPIHERWLDLPLGPHLLVSVLLFPPGDLRGALLDRLTAACLASAQLTLALHERFSGQSRLGERGWQGGHDGRGEVTG